MAGAEKTLHRSEVIYRDPFARRLRSLAMGMVAVMLVATGFFLGGYENYQHYQKPVEESRNLGDQLYTTEHQLEGLMQQLINAQTAVEVDRAALELVRKELAYQKRVMAELEEGVRLYKSLMAPEELEQGLMVGDMSLSRSDTPGRFHIKLIIQQIVAKHSVLSGAAHVEIVGVLGEKPVSLSLSELFPDENGDNFKLRFKYFQVIEGEFPLPEGFKAEKIQVRAEVIRPKAVRAEKQFPWMIED